MAVRHFLDIDAFSGEDLVSLINLAKALKSKTTEVKLAQFEHAPNLVMIFDKPSTRTRVSFDVGIRQIGGQSIVLNKGDMQLGRGETIADTARVLSRYADAIMLRCADHEHLAELADNASIPVINGLTDKSHPCQIMADILTFEEHRGSIKGKTIAWVGDGNNVATSWIHAAVRMGFSLRIATPEELAPGPEIKDWIAREGGDVVLMNDPAEASKGAHSIVTDVWVSMGDEDADRRYELLQPYRVNQELMDIAADDVIFMHCLPAHRGDEVTAEVIDGPQSVVFDEAENRLHMQKAILAWCLGMSEL
ncbi:MAG: ornithine carbamoyltransferase [Methyloligellaceae bacterium]